MIELVRAKIGGGPDSVRALLAGLPGSHDPQHEGGDVYSIATTHAGFLRFAIERQGYGELLD